MSVTPQSPPIIDDQTLITRSPSLVAAPVRDETVMMDIPSGRYYGLDDIASDIWRRLEKPCRFGNLIRALAADYDADEAAIARDVAKMLSLMAENKVVLLS